MAVGLVVMALIPGVGELTDGLFATAIAEEEAGGAIAAAALEETAVDADISSTAAANRISTIASETFPEGAAAVNDADIQAICEDVGYYATNLNQQIEEASTKDLIKYVYVTDESVAVQEAEFDELSAKASAKLRRVNVLNLDDDVLPRMDETDEGKELKAKWTANKAELQRLDKEVDKWYEITHPTMDGQPGTEELPEGTRLVNNNDRHWEKYAKAMDDYAAHPSNSQLEDEMTELAKKGNIEFNEGVAKSQAELDEWEDDLKKRAAIKASRDQFKVIVEENPEARSLVDDLKEWYRLGRLSVGDRADAMGRIRGVLEYNGYNTELDSLNNPYDKAPARNVRIKAVAAASDGTDMLASCKPDASRSLKKRA
jgi:hypothetical protein